MDIDLHKVAPGDSVYSIAARKYGAARVAEDWTFVQSMVRATNPDLTDLSAIRPNQYIALPPSLPPVPRPLGNGIIGPLLRPDPTPVSPGDTAHLLKARELLCRMSEPEQALINMTDGLNFGVTTLDALSGYTELLSNTISSDVSKLEKAFAAYKKGAISKSQYYSKVRPDLIDDISRKMSPGVDRIMRDMVDQGRDPLRMGRGTGRVQGTDLFEKLGRNAKHLDKAAKVATVAQTGYKFFAAERPEDRREVLIVASFGTAGGMAGAKMAGAAVAVVAMVTPVGWVTVLAVGTIGVVGGSMAGETFGKWLNDAEFFDPAGRKIDGFLTGWPDDVKEGAVEAIRTAKTGAGNLATGIKELGEDIGDGVADVAHAAWDSIDSGAEGIGGQAKVFGGAVADTATDAWDWLAETWRD